MSSFSAGDRKELMHSLGMIDVGEGIYKWQPKPVAPIKFPKKIEDLLKQARASAVRDQMDPKGAAMRHAIEAQFEQPDAFSPSAEEVAIEDGGDPEEGLHPNPAYRGLDWNHYKMSPFWPGAAAAIQYNRRVRAFVHVWKDVLPVFEAQYAEYLVNPAVVTADETPVQLTALVLSPESTGSKMPALDLSDLVFTPEDLAVHAVHIPAHVELHLELATGLLERARQLQNERENKAAQAATFALELVQYLAEDRRQRLDIAAGVTVAPIIEAHSSAEAARIEAANFQQQSETLRELVNSIDNDSPVAAAERLAYVGAWMQTALYGPEIVAHDGQKRQRADEARAAAKHATELDWRQQKEMLHGQAGELWSRFRASYERFVAHGERAASAAHVAHNTLRRINDTSLVALNKIVLASTPGGPLNYAQQEQQVRMEYVAALRRALLRLVEAENGMRRIFDYAPSLPDILHIAYEVCQGKTIPEDRPSPAQTLTAATRWARDASEWLLRTRRRENRWTHVISLRALLGKQKWDEATETATFSFSIDALNVGAIRTPRLCGMNLEAVPIDEHGSRFPYWTASVTLPVTGLYPQVSSTNQLTQESLSKLPLGRIRTLATSRSAPAPEHADKLTNASPIGTWQIGLAPAGAVDDILLHLWLIEKIDD